MKSFWVCKASAVKMRPATGKQGKRACATGILIGFLSNDDLQEGFLTLMRPEREQMGSRSVSRLGPSNGLAIQRNGIIWLSL